MRIIRDPSDIKKTWANRFYKMVFLGFLVINFLALAQTYHFHL